MAKAADRMADRSALALFSPASVSEPIDPVSHFFLEEGLLQHAPVVYFVGCVRIDYLFGIFHSSKKKRGA